MWKIGRGKPGRPSVPQEVRDLILMMSLAIASASLCVGFPIYKSARTGRSSTFTVEPSFGPAWLLLVLAFYINGENQNCVAETAAALRRCVSCEGQSRNQERGRCVKIAVLAPMPKASESTAAAVKPGLRPTCGGRIGDLATRFRASATPRFRGWLL
jgi:hypothetical protein